ncbi:hypothetical protein N9377_04405 [Candidatus Pelagibacter sp.]|nr:hypothetical protein [Candidatus Pelagibacter sp.]
MLKKNKKIKLLFLLLLILIVIVSFMIKPNKKNDHSSIFEIYKKVKVSQIFGLNIYQNNLYAASTFHNRIVKLDLDGNYLNFMNYFGNFEKPFQNNDDIKIFKKYNKIVGKMTNVHSIDFDRNGNMYISQYVTNKGGLNRGFTFVPKKCHGNCNEKDLITFKGFKGVSHSLFDIKRDNLLVSDYGDGEEKEGDIFIFNLNDLKNKKKLSLISNHKFKKPHIIRHDNINYYVVDMANKEIIIMDKNFKILKKINNDFLEKKNNLKNIFKTIVSITFSDKFIFVSDVGTHSIFAFDYEWNLKFKIQEDRYTYYNNKITNLTKSISESKINFKLHSPYDIFYNEDKLYIANTHNDELIILNFNKN